VPSTRFLLSMFFLVRLFKPKVCAQICLDTKAMVEGMRVPHCPLRIQQILCPRGDDLRLQVLILSETGLRHFPLASAPSPLSTADTVSKFSLLIPCQLQSQSTSLHVFQNKKTLGNVLNQTRICLYLDVMNHPEDIYLCQLPLCILPFDLGWQKAKILWSEIKIN